MSLTYDDARRIARDAIRTACDEAFAEHERQHSGSSDETITYRGSVTDLATDVAYLLTPQQGQELIQELQRFQARYPEKFQGKGR